ncbi:hypothetical protein [Streptomyces achromogenes]|uniref:hypothetical protein n=1 Tax=Streptomyces achromogenes TaxID=67255 RepID=UPI0033D28EAB
MSLRENGRLKSVDRGAHPSLTAYFNTDDLASAPVAMLTAGKVTTDHIGPHTG